MRTSTSTSERRVSKPRRNRTPLRQPGLDQGELDRLVFKAGTDESPSQVLPLEGQPAPTTSPLFTPITGVTGLSVQFADDGNTTCVVNLGSAERATTSGGPGMVEAEAKMVPLLAYTEGTIGARRESADNVSNALQVKAHNDENEACEHTSSTGTGVYATQSIAAEREKAGVQVNIEVARPPSGFDDAPADLYPRGPYDPMMEADQEDMQVDFSTPMDKDDDESDTGFGVLSNTTFHPLLTYQPHLYGHGLNIEQDDPIIEDFGSGLGADSVMEDAMPESRNVAVPATATRTVQPFAWVPPSTSNAFHAIFPGLPFARTQMTTGIDDCVPVFQHIDPYGVDKTNSEDTRVQQVASPQDIARPFVLDGTYSMEGGLPKEPQLVYAKHSPTFRSSVFPRQTTSHPSFLSPSPPMSKVDPAPLSSRRPTEVHKAEVNDLEGEVCSEPAVAASVQPEVTPPRYV